MPMKKRQKTPQRRRRFVRRKMRRMRVKPVTTKMKGIGFSDTVFAKLAYVDRIKVPGGAVSSNYSFVGNSCYDPDPSIGGHQPMYFDQYSAVYGRYRVLGSSIKVDCINISNNAALYWVLEPNTVQASSTTSISQIYEQSRSGAPRIVPVASRISSRYKKYASTRKVCGLTSAQMGDDSFAASTGTNPSNLWYWNLYFESIDGLAEIDAEIVVKIVYYVQFYDRVEAAQS